MTQQELKQFGEFVRDMRDLSGLSLKDFADDLGVFRTTLSRWERGLHVPKKYDELMELKQRIIEITKRELDIKNYTYQKLLQSI